MQDAAQEALSMLQHEEDDQMEHSQYHHFPSHDREGAEAMVLPTEGRNRIGCFADQVKLAHALV
jgi:phage gp45-like